MIPDLDLTDWRFLVIVAVILWTAWLIGVIRRVRDVSELSEEEIELASRGDNPIGREGRGDRT